MDFQEKIMQVILFMPGFLFSLAFHEAAHGYMANKFGDPTAKLAGRVTLNPVPHMDILGTLILPIIGIFTGFFFGWGIPVPVDYRNLKNPRRDGMWISLAGPVSNLILAVIISLIIRVYDNYVDLLVGGLFTPFKAQMIADTLLQYLFLNLGLCLFNLIPIEPLDGGKILFGILPRHIGIRVDQFFSRYGMIILLILYFTRLLSVILLPPIQFLASILLIGVR